MKLSLVIPVLNEVDSLRELLTQIAKVASEQSLDIEVIFVDDGSHDGSWKLIEQLSEYHIRILTLDKLALQLILHHQPHQDNLHGDKIY